MSKQQRAACVDCHGRGMYVLPRAAFDAHHRWMGTACEPRRCTTCTGRGWVTVRHPPT